MSESFVEKRKVSPHAADKENVKKPAIPGLLDPSIAIKFLEDPFISQFCDDLAQNQSLVQVAQQLLEALQGSSTLEDGSLNEAAVRHFTLVLKTWQSADFRSMLRYLMTKRESVVSTVIKELSNGVGDEDIGKRMCRVKAYQPLKHILEVTNPPATMIRGLLITLIAYWSYKELPGKLDEIEWDALEENGGNIDDSDLERRLEEQMKWVLEHQSPIEILDREPAIEDLANDIKVDPFLFEKARRCMTSLNNYDPLDDDSLYNVKEHWDIAYEFLEDPHFIHLLFERIKTETEARTLVREHTEGRVKVQSKDALAVVCDIINDPGFYLYRERMEKNEVGGALRIFLSILIVHWIHKDVYEKLWEKLSQYARERSARTAALKRARAHDKFKGNITFSTRFAGDFKDLEVVLQELYGETSFTHMYKELQILQYEFEIGARKLSYDVEMDVKAQLHNGLCAWGEFAFRGK